MFSNWKTFVSLWCFRKKKLKNITKQWNGFKSVDLDLNEKCPIVWFTTKDILHSELYKFHWNHTRARLCTLLKNFSFSQTISLTKFWNTYKHELLNKKQYHFWILIDTSQLIYIWRLGPDYFLLWSGQFSYNFRG